MIFKIETEEDIAAMAKAVLVKLTLDDKKLLVTCKKYERNRSLEQNALYWKWITIISNEIGYSKEEMHEIYKEKFLLKIFCRDDKEYMEMAKSIAALKPNNKKEYLAIRKKVINLTSTTKANISQMCEYLTSIKFHAQGELDIQLPMPEEEDLLVWADKQVQNEQ